MAAIPPSEEIPALPGLPSPAGEATAEATADANVPRAAGPTVPRAGRAMAPIPAVRLRAMREAGSPRRDPYSVKVQGPGSVDIELRVEDQNPHIGLRNVHRIHSGASKTLGGGRSDFLVFLVPLPRRLAELHFDGLDLTLVPLRPEFFPGAVGPISACLGKEIEMASARGYRLRLRFLRYEPPALRINRLLHCIETPGILIDLDFDA
jgi:hypothetical protein